MTQEDLAKATGLTRGYISRLEIGRHSPTIGTLRKIAKALNVRVERLL